MRKVYFFIACLIFFSSGCSVITNTNTGQNNTNNQTSTNTNTSNENDNSSLPISTDSRTPEMGAGGTELDLLSVGAGAIFVQKPSESSPGYVGLGSLPALLDENGEIGWWSDKGQITNQTIVIELPEKTLLKTLSFDTANVYLDQTAAKDIVVEMSDISSTTGFQEILNTTLTDKTDNQRFNVQHEVPGRWLRLNIKNNYGSPEYVEMYEMRGYGEQQTKSVLDNISGTYKNVSEYHTANFANFHIKQEGTSIVGCFGDLEREGVEGLFEGGIDGRVAQITWKMNGGKTDDDIGSGVMIFSQDGKKMYSFWSSQNTKDSGLSGAWEVEKSSNTIGNCPSFKDLDKPNAAGGQIADDLREKGRARIYGINFDFNSDVIRNESKPTLNQIVALLKENADWRMTIEGHTDNIGGADFNLKLSVKRAQSVRNYLIQAGIDEGRLTAAGFGLSKPVAPNEAEFGRAKNRRVELVKL